MARTRASQFFDTWLGGYVRKEANGSKGYIIAKMIRGKRYHVSARAHDEETAILKFREFEANPDGFDPRGHDDGLYFTEELTKEFLAWSEKPKVEGGKGNTKLWVGQQRLYLAWWAARLGVVNLKTLQPSDISKHTIDMGSEHLQQKRIDTWRSPMPL